MNKTSIPKIERIDPKEQDNLAGRTARLLDYCSTNDYILLLRDMLCEYVCSDNFDNMNKLQRSETIFTASHLLEFIAQLDKEGQ